MTYYKIDPKVDYLEDVGVEKKYKVHFCQGQGPQVFPALKTIKTIILIISKAGPEEICPNITKYTLYKV